jgi:serine/threonine-protein kinase
MLAPGRLLAGKYRLTREIGHGGMGAVWEAVHEALERPVAVKFLKPWTNGDPARSARFVSEARMVAALKHRFVVDVFDFGVSDEGLYYMVLELLNGQTLARRIDDGPPFRVHEAVHLIADCLRGLHAVHEAGIVHRDLKPDNIVIVQDADGVFPKLIDFGISKRTEDERTPATPEGAPPRKRSRLTAPGMVIGTLDYMPPEQLRGRDDLDRRADVYSMGVILYEWLAGRLPFDHDNIGDLVVAITIHGAPPLRAVRPDLGDKLSHVLARALASRPEDRYPNALVLREGLLAALIDVPSGALSGELSVPSKAAEYSEFPLGTDGVADEPEDPTTMEARMPEPARAPRVAPRLSMRVIAGRRTGPLALLLLCTAGLALGGLWWARAYGTGPSEAVHLRPAEPVPGTVSAPESPPTAAGTLAAAAEGESPVLASESPAAQSSEAAPPSAGEAARPAHGPRTRSSKAAGSARPGVRKIYRELDF